MDYVTAVTDATSSSGIDPTLIVGVIAILVAITIAVWQHGIARHYVNIEKAERAQLEAKRAADLALAHRRQANRDYWDQEYQEYREILTKLEDMESAVREGPLTPDQTDENELGRMQRRLDNVSTRCPEALRDPLKKVAEAVRSFRGVHIISEADVTKEYNERVATMSAGCPAPLISAKKIGAMAIAQYEEAVKLHGAIYDAWKALNTERGESLARQPHLVVSVPLPARALPARARAGNGTRAAETTLKIRQEGEGVLSDEVARIAATADDLRNGNLR